jgi:nucleoporin NUP1
VGQLLLRQQFHSVLVHQHTFAAKKPEESKPFGGFSAPQAPPINTSFSFGKDESRPTSAFTFGQTPTSATNPPAFSFGVQTNGSSNPFGAATGSAPGSPSTFAQPAPFSFGTPVATTGGFAFGSQPSSPAGGGHLTLPQPTISTTATFGSGAGFGQTPSPASPFTAPLPLAQSISSGGTPLFTMGAAPIPPPGQRQIKKLPRRGNVKR